MKNWCFFRRAFALFRDPTNVPIVYVFIYYTACLGFSVFSVFPTKIARNWCRNAVQKNHRKIMVWASILGTKIDENRRRKAPKALKLRKNVVFGRHRFLIVFSMHFSMNFGSPRRPRGAPKIDFSAFLFDFFARLSPQSCSWGLLGPFRVNFSSIFGWFGVFFGRFWVGFFQPLVRATKKAFNEWMNEWNEWNE